MLISVVYLGEGAQTWVELQAAEACTAMEAIALSGVLRQHPEIDLTRMKVGVFGRLIRADLPLQEGDRVEIYPPLIRQLDDEDDEDD